MRAHAIMIALPYQGHLNPFVDLAMKLVSKGITVTLVHTEHAHHQILKAARSSEADILSEARASGVLDVRYATISDGFPIEFDREANFVEYWETLLRNFSSIVDEFVGDLIATTTSEFEPSSLSTPPPFLVADTFAAWPAMVAKKYGLVNVSFWTEPAKVFAINYHMHLLVQNGHYPPKDNEEHLISYIPGVDPISSKDLMSHLQEANTTVVHDIVFGAFKNVLNADFILHNTVQELEHQTLSLLDQKQPTYAIGPIKLSTKTNPSVPKSLLYEVDCSKWLDSRPPGSVLYVSFGSMAQINKEVMQELAQGLLLSRVNFLWVIRAQISVDNGDIFENGVKDRGLVVPWCDQLAVLSSPAVGGFLTHCGWNSTVESIWCGVPMICYPVMYDQPTNRKMVVDDWKIGINLCDGECVVREEVAEKISELMNGERIRYNMKEVRSKVCDAWNEEGSSKTNFDRFLKDLNDKMNLGHDVLV